MKLENYRKSKTGNEETIGIFAMGKSEAQIIHDLVKIYLGKIPQTLETSKTKNRLRTIKKCLNKALTSWGEEMVEIPIVGEIEDENVTFYDGIEEKLNKPNKNIHKVSGKSVFKLQEIIKKKGSNE